MTRTETHVGAMERARIGAGMSELDVAHHFGVNPQTVRRWERGAHCPSQATWLRLAGLYGVSAADLMDLD